MPHEELSEENNQEVTQDELGGVAVGEVTVDSTVLESQQSGTEKPDSDRAYEMAHAGKELRDEAAKDRTYLPSLKKYIKEAQETGELFDAAKTEQEKVDATNEVFSAILKLQAGDETFSFNGEEPIKTQLIYQLFDMEGHRDLVEWYITATLDKSSDLDRDGWQDSQGKIVSVNKMTDHIKGLYGETGVYRRNGETVDEKLNTEEESDKRTLVEKALWKFDKGIGSDAIDEARNKLREMLDEELKKHQAITEAKPGEEIGYQVNDFWPSKLAEDWRSKDDRADKAEEWASILYDNPVSQAYRETHPEVSFTGEGLNLVTDHIALLKKEIEELQNEISEFEQDGQWVQDLVEKVGKDEIAKEEMESLFAQDSTTVGELKAHFKKPYEQKLEKLESKVRLLSEVLDEVKSGKASKEGIEATS